MTRTQKLGLCTWLPEDPVCLAEVNDNFTRLDDSGGQQFHAVAAIKHTGVGRNLRAVAECVNLHICVCRVTALMRLRRHQAAELHQSSLCQPQRPTAAVVQPRKIVVDLCKANRVLRQPRA